MASTGAHNPERATSKDPFIFRTYIIIFFFFFFFFANFENHLNSSNQSAKPTDPKLIFFAF